MSVTENQPFTLEDEVKFWGLQTAEHQALIYTGLIDPIYAETLNEPLALAPSINVKTLKEEALRLHNRWQNIIKNPKVRDAITTMDDTLIHQNRIFELTQQGFIGYLYPSLIEHIIQESNYFRSKLSGFGYNLNEEINFWVDHHKGETAVVEKQLDPTETELGYIIRDYDERLEMYKNNPDAAYRDMGIILNTYDDLGVQLLKDMATGKVKTISPPALVEHAIREGQRAIEIFQWFRNQQ